MEFPKEIDLGLGFESKVHIDVMLHATPDADIYIRLKQRLTYEVLREDVSTKRIDETYTDEDGDEIERHGEEVTTNQIIAVYGKRDPQGENVKRDAVVFMMRFYSCGDAMTDDDLHGLLSGAMDSLIDDLRDYFTTMEPSAEVKAPSYPNDLICIMPRTISNFEEDKHD